MTDQSPPPPDDAPEQGTAPLPPLGSSAGGDPPPDAPSPPDGSGDGSGLPRWLLPVAGAVVIVGLAAALVFVLLSGDDEPESAQATGGASAEFLVAVRAPVQRLNRSAQVTGRVLTRASRPNDVNRVARTADQQLAVIQQARVRISEIPAEGRDRAVRGALSRATQSHRTYLTSLARLDTIETAAARRQMPRLRTQAQRTLTQYRAFFAEAPGLAKGITAAGLADLSGLNQALSAKLKQEQQAAEEAEDAGTSGGSSSGASGGSSGGSSSAGPVLSGVYGADRGTFIEVGANYCDRTPGAVNDFVYTFEIRQNGVTVASDSYGASQTRACNTISTTFNDIFALGSYEVAIRVSNQTNGVAGSATGSLSVVN